jgi:hypothetical protein
VQFSNITVFETGSMQKLFVEIYAQLNEVSENVVEPARRLNEIGEGAEGLRARQYLELVEVCLAAVVRQLQAIGESEDPQELLTRQAELATEWKEAVQAMAHEMRERQVDATPALAPSREAGISKSSSAVTRHTPCS